MVDATVHIGNVLDILPTLPAESVNCVVTSPPYWGLRDYGQDGQLGLEPTPDEYVARMVAVFREVRRVLRDDGTLWLNLGDSYAADRGGTYMPAETLAGGVSGHGDQSTMRGRGDKENGNARRNCTKYGLKHKDLCGIPWRVAFALQADGWVLRQEVIWSKPNPMPESVTDRCTKAHEQLFMFCKAGWTGPQPGQFGHVSDTDARWIAGLIDCEGSIVVKRVRHDGRGDTFAPQVSIGSTSRELLAHVVRILGRGNALERPGKNAPMYYVQFANGVARDLLHRIYPFLVIKRRQARIGIYLDSLTYYRGGQRPQRKMRTKRELEVLMSLWRRNHELNHFGDPDISDVPDPEYGRWSKAARYWYDAEAISEDAFNAGRVVAYDGTQKNCAAGDGINDRRTLIDRTVTVSARRNRRSVWHIATQPYPEAHFATYPEKLVEPCVLAGCPVGGTVLDPFTGSGTTGAVACRLGRNFVGIELNPEYAAMAERRIAPHRDQMQLVTP